MLIHLLSPLLICLAPIYSSAAPTVFLQGRFSPGGSNATAELPQLYSWAASSVYVTFTGAEYVSVRISALPPKGSTFSAINWFRVFVDDEFAADAFTSNNKLNLSVTLNVSSSVHNLRVAKVNEGSLGEASLQGIDLSPGGSFLAPAPPASVATGKRMLIFGASYTVGYGNVGAALPNSCEPKPYQLQQDWNNTCASLKISMPAECASFWHSLNENSLQAFSAVAAEALGADFQVIATSGGGMVGYSSANQTTPPTNQALFNRSTYGDANSSYPLHSWTPQVVVIASGTNDWNSVPPVYSLDQWLDKGIAFLQQISQTYNEPTIVLMAWPPAQQLAGVLSGTNGVNETANYVQALSSLYTQATRQKMPNIHYLQLDTTGYDNYHAWCDGHPSAYADGVIAEQLVTFITAVKPSWGNVTEIDLNIAEVAIRPNTSLYSTPTPASNAGSLSQG